MAGSSSVTARPNGVRAAARRSPSTSCTQAGVYQERSDPSLFVRFPLLERPGESLVIWTTTPWTLPANVAAAVKPDAEYGLRENGEWVAVARYPDEHFVAPCSGRRARRAALPRPVRRARARWRGGAPGDPVGRGLAGGGNRDRPHRAGGRAGGLRARARPRAAGALAGRRGGPLLRRLRLAPRALDDRGRRPDRRPAGRAGIPRSRRARTSTATRTAGAATRRSSGGSPTTG